MKKLFFLLLATPSLLCAGGPQFQHKDTFVQQEFENVYQAIDQKEDSRNLTAGTSRQLLIGQGIGTQPVFASFGIVQASACVVTVTSNTTSTSFVDTPLNCTITPFFRTASSTFW